jgi:DNA-3-methyladenine glycosylase
VRRYRPLGRRFFTRHTLVVARALLGHLLVHETPQGRLVGRIVETEAYRGPRDPASHAFRRTPRSAIMFGRPGTAYVYFTYGMHYCLNVTTEPEGRPGAVLLRALEIAEGGRRQTPAAASGPARLTTFMRVGPRHNGADLTAPPLFIARGRRPRRRIVRGPRVGVAAAAGRRWRFGLAGHPSLSRPF